MSFMFLVSAWLLLYAKWTISQLYDEMIMMSDQSYTNTLSWIFILLTHGSNSQRVHISLHLDTVSWFRPNRSLFFLFNAVYFFGEAANTNIMVFGLTWQGREPHSRLECFPLHHLFDWGFVVLNVIYNNCIIHIHVVIQFCYRMRCFQWKRICTGFFPSFIYICITVYLYMYYRLA